MLHPLTSSCRPLYSTTDPIDGAIALNISEWVSLETGFDAPVCLVLNTGYVLFGDYVSFGGASLEDLNAARNCLVTSDLDELQDWFSMLRAQAVEDFAVINETAFSNAWMDVRGENGTLLSILQDILLMHENLDLEWILPGIYFYGKTIPAVAAPSSNS